MYVSDIFCATSSGLNLSLKCQVSQLVAQLFQMRVRMKNLMGVMEGGSIPALSNLEDALKAEQKVVDYVCSLNGIKHVYFSIFVSCFCLGTLKCKIRILKSVLMC